MSKVGISVGRWGEGLAEAKLQSLGMQILDRRWRTRDGEIDLIAREGSTLVFVEVKTRRSARFGTPAEAVTVAKQRRIRQLALAWLSAHDERARDIRFDVVSVLSLEGGPTVEHLRGAF